MKEFYTSLLSHEMTPSEKVSMAFSTNTVLKPWSRLSAQDDLALIFPVGLDNVLLVNT